MGGIALWLHGDGDQMADPVIPCRPFIRAVKGRRPHAAGNALAAHEQMEMAVFAFFGSVGMIIILAVAIVIKDVAVGIVIPFIECAIMGNDLAHHIGGGLFQHAVTFLDLGPGRGHFFQPLPR